MTNVCQQTLKRDETFDPATHWLAKLQVELHYLDQKTRLGLAKHHGPLRIQRPFYPDSPEQAHLYLLHPPGGLVAGDRLHLDVTLHQHAKALLTTPSAGKIYKNITEKEQLQHTCIMADKEAVIEWLPQETIVFDGAQGCLKTEVHLHSDASFIGWELVCLGRPQGGHTFNQGYLKQEFSIYRDNEPVWLERNRLNAASPIRTQASGFGGFCVYGTMVLTGKGLESLPWHLESTKPHPDDLISITQKNDLVILRYLGSCTERAKNTLAQYWCKASAKIHGHTPSVPRIWHT